MLPFGRLWYGKPNAVRNAIGYAKHRSRSLRAVIRVYDAAGNVIETHERGRFQRMVEGFCLSAFGSAARIKRMDPLEDDRTLIIRLDMARLRARFNVATDEQVEDILMEHGVLRDSDPDDWVCAGRCLTAFEAGEVMSQRQV